MTTLNALLEFGFDSVAPSDLLGIAADAKDRCWSTGDVRYCIAADVIEIIDSCWGDDGAVRASVVDQIDAFLRGEFSRAIFEIDAETSRYLALSARTSLISIITAAGDLLYG